MLTSPPYRVPLISHRPLGLKLRLVRSPAAFSTSSRGGVRRSRVLHRLIPPLFRLFAASQRPSGLNARASTGLRACAFLHSAAGFQEQAKCRLRSAFDIAGHYGMTDSLDFRPQIP
jgi:hypothetical protein